MNSKLKLTLGLLASSTATAFAQQQLPSPESMLQYKPAHRDIDYDVPPVADIKKCRVEYEGTRKPVGYALFDANGVVLRRYSDVNGDRLIDAWRYYKNGIEVYRDIDSDFNQKIDQSRWINAGGARWGIDKNEDGRIESWKSLSAEEATRVAINAMVAGDISVLSTVLITKEDLNSLGVEESIATGLLRQVQEPNASVRTVLSKGGLTSQSRWSRMDAAMPSLIPLDEGKAKVDLLIYEGAMAFVETAGKHGIVQIGEMIKVGDVWKLTQIPTPMNANEPITTMAGLLMKPSASGLPAGNDLTPEMQELLKRLEVLQKNLPTNTATKADFVKFHSQRRAIVFRLAELSQSADQRLLWTQQLANALVSLTQLGEEDALTELRTIEATWRKADPQHPLVATIAFQLYFTEYSSGMSNPDAKAQQKANEKWFQDLEKFVEEFPKSDEAIEALIAIAVNAEHNRDLEKARKYYKQLRTRKDVAGAVERSEGALRRLDLVASTAQIAGKDINGRPIDVATLRGKVVVVLFWDSGAKEFHEDLPVLKGLVDQYGDRGFAIVGVCTDQDPKAIAAFVQQNKINFPSIHDDPKLKTSLAMQYGIHKTPLMFLINQQGKVVSNDISSNDLKVQLTNAFNAKTGK